MRLALAQFDARLGDIEGICSRIEAQAELASRNGCHLLCTPVPLFAGILPGGLINSENFQHDVLNALVKLADSVADLGVTCLVPAIIPFDNSQLFDVFMLKEGHVFPLRLVRLLLRMGALFNPWDPPVFDVDGSRVAVFFDAQRDASCLPGGCDLAIYFQVNGFDADDSQTVGVAAVQESGLADIARDNMLWIACMAPVGGYGESVFTGGSYVLDDAGRVVAAAPSFEEALLIQDVQRGVPVEAVPVAELPVFSREKWLWNALCIHLRDTARSWGTERVAIHMNGDLQSTLTAALAVDALGPRNVTAVLMLHEDVSTPWAEAAELERLSRARATASALRVRVVERSLGGSDALDGDVQGEPDEYLRRAIEGLCLADTARRLGVLPISSLTKTDYALAVGLEDAWGGGRIAPFGDVYLTELEFLAKSRNQASPVISDELMRLVDMEGAMRLMVERAICRSFHEPSLVSRVRALLEQLTAADIDGILEAHVDRNLPFEEIDIARKNPKAAALLLLMVKNGEALRRGMPIAPVVSSRSFMERAWPVQLAWSDVGRRGAEVLTADGLVAREQDYLEASAENASERARGEVMQLIGGIFGLSAEQLGELQGEEQSEETQRKLQEGFQKFEAQMREAFARQARPGSQGGYSIFSQN